MKLASKYTQYALIRVFIVVACIAALLPHASLQRAYAASVLAEAVITAPATTPLGQNFSFTVDFDNVGGATGYGPYLNVFMPSAGADGGSGAPNDGLDFISATFLGSPLTQYVLSCPVGSTVRSPLTGLTVSCPAAPAGTNKLIVLQLPFGSFTAPQAPAIITINASASNLADVGVPLPISAQAGFIYGDSPTNFEPSQGVLTTTTVAPSLFTLTKTSDEVETETATGRNYPHEYSITPAMPAGIPAANVIITETLPPDVVLLSIAGASVMTGPVVPGGPYAPPNNQIVFNYGSLVGSGAPITLRYYISKTTALGADVLPTSGGNSARTNIASGSGTWTPIDPRDIGSPFTATTALTNTNRALALQKSVTDSAPPTRPSDVLTYTLAFQLSDFFSLGSIFITDTFADGQSYVPGSATLSVSERGNTVAGTFPAVALVTTNLGGAGTRMVFNVSQALPVLGASDGVLQGGAAIAPASGPAIGTLTYRVQVNDTYANGNPLLATDRLSNTAVIAGNVLNNTNLTQAIGRAQDGAAAGFQVLTLPTLAKTFYAINDSNTLPSPLKLSPGDSVTYRITYAIGTGDFNNLTVTDFLPLPVHDAALITSFISSTAGIPAAGVVQWGPGMSSGDLSRVPLPTLTANAANNSFVLGFGNRQDASNTPTQIDLLFTSVVQDKPFIDDLYLTNQVNTQQANSAGQVVERNAIQPFTTAAPRVRVRKGILGSSNPNSVLTSTAGPVAFSPVGTTACNARFSGIINSLNLATTPINANLQNADAGDVVRMGILVENIGSSLSGAFDVAISDTLPANMSFVSGSLCVQRGDGTLLPTNGNLFTTGITLSVPLSQGVDYGGARNSSGSNLTLFSFDVLLDAPISPSQTLTNSTRLLNYAAQRGAANFVPIQGPSTPLTDTAQVSISPLRFGKQLMGSELSNANNGAAQAVVGELITYTLVLTAPEGTTSNALITDTLPTGLLFAACTNVAASSGLVSTLALSPAAVCSTDPTGTILSFNLGTLTNTDNDDAVTETLTITYTAIVLNVSANVTGTSHINNAQFNWAGNTPLTATASPITVIEPRLLTSKDGDLKFGDAFDVITFTLIVTNPATNSTNLYDTVLTDVIPSGMSYVAGSLTAVSGPAPVFQIAAPAFTATWPILAPGQTSVFTFAATLDPNVVPGSAITNTARASGSSLPGDILTRTANINSGERSYTASNASAVFIVSPPTAGKFLISTEISNTANSNTQVVVGELITYSVVMTVPEGVTPNARLTDTLDTGLAFVSFVSITTSSDVQFDDLLDSYLTPTVQAVSAESGRRAVWAFGTLTNTNTSNAISETLRITYTAIVLNTSNNADGTTRRNSAVLGWSKGSLAAVLAQNVQIIEPRMGVTKSVTPTTGDSGDVITYTLVITGPSGSDAFDVRLSDRLPFTTGSSLILDPAIASVSTNDSPVLSAADFALTGSNSVGFTLTSVNSFDAPVNIGRRITVVLTGTLPVIVVPSAFFTNTAMVTYTSLSGFAQPITRSQLNPNSTERIYTVTGAAPFQVLPLLATKEFITTSEAFTGIGADGNPRAAIGEVIAYRLWIQLAESTSPNLTVDFFDNLPAGLEFTPNTTRIAFVSNGAGITSTLVTPGTLGCSGLNVSGNSSNGVLPTQVTCPVPASAISFDANGRPKFAFGGVSNFDTDNDGEFIIVQFNAVVKNQASNQSGTAITNTFNVLINGVPADDSPPITTTVATPAIALSKAANAVAAIDAGDLITYTLIFSNAAGPNISTAFDLVLTDTLDANLELQRASLNAPAPAINYTSASNSVITTSNALTVAIAQLDPGASVTVTVFARLRDATPNGARIPNTAFVSFTSLPTTTGTLNNPTGTTTPGASGTITGERTGVGGVNDFFNTSNLVTTTLNTPTVLKLAPVPSVYTIGELITYSLVITVPEGVAQNVSVLDALPSGLLPVSSQVLTSGAPLLADYNGVLLNATPSIANGAVLFAFGDVTTTADNQSDNNAFVVQVVAQVADVPANADGTLLTNTARLTYTHPVSGVLELTSTQRVTIIEPNVQTSKSVVAPRNPVGAGDEVTYTIRLTNTGSAPALDVTVTDTLPNAINFVEPFAFTSSLPASGTHTATSAAFALPQINVGSSLVITFTARISDSVAANQSLNNSTYSIYSSLPGAQIAERHYTTPQATATLTTGLPALILSKSAAPSPVFAGELLTFSLRLTNTGSVQATNVVITDRVPSSTTFVSAPNATQVGNVLSWTQPALAPGDSVTQTLVVRVDQTAPNNSALTNTVRAQSAENITSTATVTVPVLARPDLAISKSATPEPVLAGQPLTYTLAYTNLGPNGANGVVITDVLPAGVTFGGVVTQPANIRGPTQDGQTLTWTLGSLNANTSGAIIFSVTVGSAALELLTNTAVIGNTTPDSNPTNNTATQPTTVAYADVFASKTVQPADSVLPGGVLTWTIAFGNAGNYTATVITISDTLPTDVAFGGVLSQSAGLVGPNATGQILQWTLAQLAPNENGRIVLTGTAATQALANNVLRNQVEIRSSTPQTNTRNDEGSVTTLRTALVLRKQASRSPIIVGEAVSFTIRLSNTGGVTLTNLPLTDTFDASLLQFESASLAPSRTTNGELSWLDVGSLAPGAAASVVVTFTALKTTSGLTTANRVTTTGEFSGTLLPLLNASAVVRITQPVLSVSKHSSANGFVQPGQRITYTLIISNAGDADAVGVAVSDALPAQTTGASFNINGITVSAGSQVSFTYSITANTPLISGTQIVNAVSITSSNSAVLTPTATVTDVVGSAHALQLTKTAEPASVVAGGLLTYTLAYTISGNAPAPDVTIADVLPAGVSVVTTTPPTNNQSTNKLLWQLGTLNPPASGSITVVVRVPSAMPNGALLVNTATMTDASGLRAQSTVTTPVLFGTDLNIVKSVEPSVVANGGLVTFTLVVSNPGPSDIPAPAPIVIPGDVQDTLGPAQPFPATIIVTDDVQITDITVTLAALSHGFAADLDVLLVGPNGQRVLLMSDAGGIHPVREVSLNFHDGAVVLPDIEQISSGVYAPIDYVGNDNIDTLPAPAPARPYGAKLAAFKGSSAKGEWRLFIYDDQDNDVGGALRGWMLTLATTQGNKSYSFAQGMRVLDTLPPGFTLVAASPGYAGPNPVAWVDGIRAGETRSYTLTARANRAGSDVMTNTAVVSSPLPELNVSNNTSSAAVFINSANLAVITPTLPITPTPPGGVLTITIPISNSGNVTATGTVITITLPNGDVKVIVIGDIPPGSDVTVVVTVTVPVLPPGTTLADIVITVGSDALDPSLADNVYVIVAPIDGLPHLTIAKTADPPAGTSLRVGDRITYTVRVTNMGAVTATNLILTDSVPANTSYVTGTAQPTPAASNPLVWRVPVLAAGATFAARFAVAIIGVGTGTSPITNVAVLSGDFVSPTQSNAVLHVYLPSAVQLLRFGAQRTTGGVQVSWVTGAEVNTFGFALYRSLDGSRANAVRVNDELIPAKGATGASYAWLDASAQPEVAYTYWLQEIETSGRINEYGPAVIASPNLPQLGASHVFLPLVVR